MSLFPNDHLVQRFARCYMKHGRFGKALAIIDSAFQILKTNHEVQEPVRFFYEAVQNAKPLVETKPLNIGSKRVPQPRAVGPKRQEGLALRFIARAVYDKRRVGRKNSDHKLAAELVALHKKEGAARKMRDDKHKLAEANRAYVR
ncbi:30S ribosomal protein S7 [Porphyridium purpureum]|uniref:30S ribosomal protein S7 n=1 Tax=Porphyridium purpureum TaxID=35688 RepID=A0A5J4YPN1_PORPP|nr:30S ribosomal protein S7 [Porphyridium purpureum]|eukprot:POR5397..scf222_8